MEAHLTVEEGASRTVFVLQSGQTGTLGAGPGATFTLREPSAAPQHLALKLEGEVLTAVDTGGPAGTWLNDQRLVPHTTCEVFSDDVLTIGAHKLRVSILGRGMRPVRRRPKALTDPLVPAAEFELLRELGAGAAGKVYAARWIPRGQRVAIKVLHDDVAPGSEEHERFMREAGTVSRLQSPFVVQVHDLRQVGSRAYIVMELVEGPSAREYLVKARGRLPIAEALRIAEDIGQALVLAAAEGIVHRDVKPANMILSPSGCVKLCDFGVAKDLDSTLHSLTASGMGLGSMAYLPPEQVAEAKYVDPRADVYSLGATLYHLIAGKPPFKPTNAKALLEIIDQPPPALAALRPDCPPDVVQAVEAMMAKEPDDRPPAWRVVEGLRKLRARHYPNASLDALFRQGGP